MLFFRTGSRGPYGAILYKSEGHCFNSVVKEVNFHNLSSIELRSLIRRFSTTFNYFNYPSDLATDVGMYDEIVYLLDKIDALISREIKEFYLKLDELSHWFNNFLSEAPNFLVLEVFWISIDIYQQETYRHQSPAYPFESYKACRCVLLLFSIMFKAYYLLIPLTQAAAYSECHRLWDNTLYISRSRAFLSVFLFVLLRDFEHERRPCTWGSTGYPWISFH